MKAKKKVKKREDEPLKINGSLYDVLKKAVEGNPKPRKEKKKN